MKRKDSINKAKECMRQGGVGSKKIDMSGNENDSLFVGLKKLIRLKERLK